MFIFASQVLTFFNNIYFYANGLEAGTDFRDILDILWDTFSPAHAGAPQDESVESARDAFKLMRPYRPNQFSRKGVSVYVGGQNDAVNDRTCLQSWFI